MRVKFSASTGTRVTRSERPSKSILMYSFFLLVFLFVFLVLVGVLGLVGAGFAFLGYGDFVAFGRKGIFGVFAQGERVEGVPAIGGVIELNVAELRIERARADE